MNNNTQLPWNNDIINIVTIASYLLSIQNLELNQKQTSNDTLDNHLEEQDKILHEQNEKYLKTIIQQNEKIIELLTKGDSK